MTIENQSEERARWEKYRKEIGRYKKHQVYNKKLTLQELEIMLNKREETIIKNKKTERSMHWRLRKGWRNPLQRG